MPTDPRSVSADPRAACAGRREERLARAARLTRQESSLSALRLATAFAAALMAWGAFGAHAMAPIWLALPAAVFIVLVLLHDRVIRLRRRLERAASYYDDCIARIDGKWEGRGEPGDRFLEEGHLYAADLDLFGKGSLFELLCTARTRSGEETLARWLLAPAPPEVVAERQAAVIELRDRIDLREEIALLGDPIRAVVAPDALRSWATAPADAVSPWVRAAVAIVPAATIAALGLWGAGIIPRPVALLAAVVQMLVMLAMRGRVARILAGVDRSVRDMDLLAGVLHRFEQERFTAPRLAALRALLEADGPPPSRCIARLHRLADLLDARRNQLFAPAAMLLMWGTQLALAIAAWRARFGSKVPRWLDAVGEVEALCALAGYSYENPGDPFPELLEGPALFEGTHLGHPLIPEARCVRNDVALGNEVKVLIVSGSNMSGKSTLLRTVGVNAVLAQAGAPVRARSLRLSRLQVGSSIRVQDSLRGGTSRFYAELKRLRGIVAGTAAQVPVLFLVDEMLHGTNSHDRRIGAEAVVRGLLDAGAVGMITTHDLALAHMTETLGARAINVHFEDRLEDGRMTFDYRLRPGVVAHSNALALMRSVGLGAGLEDEVIESHRSRSDAPTTPRHPTEKSA